jgi:hypothetical protein
MGKTTALLMVAVVVGAGSSLWADTTWNGGGDGSSWSDAANWGGTPPNGQRRAFINGVTSVVIDAAVADTVNRVILGDAANSDDVKVHMTGGSLTVAGGNDAPNLELATVGHASFQLSGGTVDIAGHVRIGTDPAPAAPVGVLTVDGGDLKVANRLYVGYGTGSVATVNMMAGSITADRIFIADGVNSKGDFLMSGGWVSSRDFWVPTNSDSKGARAHVQLDGGILNVSDFRLNNSLADDMKGTMDITGGILMLAGDHTADTTLLDYITSGVLTGYAGTGTVKLNYIEGQGTKVFAVIPEPGCLVLAALGAIVLVRKRGA